MCDCDWWSPIISCPLLRLVSIIFVKLKIWRAISVTWIHMITWANNQTTLWVVVPYHPCYVTPCEHEINMISDIVDNSNSSEASVLSNLLVKFVNLTRWAKCRKWFVAIYYESPLLKFDYCKARGGEDILFLSVTWPHLTLWLKG